MIALRAQTRLMDARAAVAALREQLPRSASGTFFFCSPRYDLEVLGRELARAFDGPLVGCTSAGQIGPQGIVLDGIVAASIDHPELELTSYLAPELVRDGERTVRDIARIASDRREHDLRPAFALVLVDGLSRVEEMLAATLYHHSVDLPILGGSAGDNLAYERTAVYHGGRFLSGAATINVVRCGTPFAPVCFHHFVPTAARLVVTDADPAQRLVREFDGLPARDAYAAALGMDPREFTVKVGMQNPLMQLVGGDWYVRSVAAVLPDGSMSLFCQLEEGTVVAVGSGVDRVARAEGAFRAAQDRVGETKLVLGCDCVLRRLEFEERGEIGLFSGLYERERVVGFNTYGEQFNSLHVNQTFAGVLFG